MRGRTGEMFGIVTVPANPGRVATGEMDEARRTSVGADVQA